MSDHYPPIVGASDEHAADARLPSAVTATPRRAADRETAPNSRKFRVATAVLVGVGVAALAVSIAIAAGSDGSASRGSALQWSSWSPPDNGRQGAQEIADFIAPYYRATPADQLSVVTAVNLKNPSNPLQVAVPAPGSPGSKGGLVPLSPSSTMLYNLCGVNSTNCSIGVGQASSNRLLLLRREALELALYTFKYISGVNTVVAILPPGHTVQGCTGLCSKPQQKTTIKALDIAVAFDRSELRPWLNTPIRSTLPELLPPTVSAMSKAPEAQLVSIITAHGLFSEHAEQAQDGSTVLVLTPMRPQ